MKIQIDPIIIVEGKYDKIKLESLVDGVVIATDGFGIFKDKAAQRDLQNLAKMRGAVILTDSDRAGFIIRKFLHDILNGCMLCDVYIPDILGKEKRKSIPSAEGKLGVEGMTSEVLKQLLDSFSKPAQKKEDPITVSDLYDWGLYGGENSSERRRNFQHHLGLPGRLNKNMLLRILNGMFTKEQCLREISAFIK